MQYSQIYTISLDFPFITIESIFLKSKIIKELFENDIVKIKNYIGSDFNIDGSGFLFHGINNSTLSIEITSKNITNFMKSYFLKILNINDFYIKENITIEINIYNNSYNNNTVIEFCFGECINNDYTKWVRAKLLKLKIKSYFEYICIKLKKYIINISNISYIRYIKMYHSIMIKVNYKTVSKYFKDFNYTAKAIGTNQLLDIKYNNNLTYSVNMNNGIIVNYQIYKEIKNLEESETLFFHKFKGNEPALNEWTKIDFFNIDKNICLLIHETKLPENINSVLYNTIYDFTIYVLKKLKIYIESNDKYN